MQRHRAVSQPFFLYLPLVDLHLPTLLHPDFAERTGVGDFVDSMVEMDHRAGQIVDEVDRLGITEDIENDLRAVKWRDWKLHSYWEPEVDDVLVFNTCVLGPILRPVRAFRESCRQFPSTPPRRAD